MCSGQEAGGDFREGHPAMMNIREMVTVMLKAKKLDGLYNECADCACLIGDLMPCGEPDEVDCRGGVKVDGCPDECGDDHKFHVVAPGIRIDDGHGA